jgi:hypothetical protein
MQPDFAAAARRTLDLLPTLTGWVAPVVVGEMRPAVAFGNMSSRFPLARRSTAHSVLRGCRNLPSIVSACDAM